MGVGLLGLGIGGVGLALQTLVQEHTPYAMIVGMLLATGFGMAVIGGLVAGNAFSGGMHLGMGIAGSAFLVSMLITLLFIV